LQSGISNYSADLFLTWNPQFICILMTGSVVTGSKDQKRLGLNSQPLFSKAVSYILNNYE